MLHLKSSLVCNLYASILGSPPNLKQIRISITGMRCFFSCCFFSFKKESEFWGGGVVVNFDGPKCVFFCVFSQVGRQLHVSWPPKKRNGWFGVNPRFGGFGGCNILRPRSGEKLGEAELVQKKSNTDSWSMNFQLRRHFPQRTSPLW